MYQVGFANLHSACLPTDILHLSFFLPPFPYNNIRCHAGPLYYRRRGVKAIFYLRSIGPFACTALHCPAALVPEKRWSRHLPLPLAGVYPISPLITGTLVHNMFPGFKIYSLAADAVFKIPGWRHFIVSEQQGRAAAARWSMRNITS